MVDIAGEVRRRLAERDDVPDFRFAVYGRRIGAEALAVLPFGQTGHVQPAWVFSIPRASRSGALNGSGMAQAGAIFCTV